MISDQVQQLCCSQLSISALAAADPAKSPNQIIEQLFNHAKPSGRSSTSEHDFVAADEETLKRAAYCGNWGPQKPSKLFLQVYADALQCIEACPLSSMVSPSLMGSHGTIPLTVIAPLADIVRHMANLIVRAEREVILVTCSWSSSIASELIADALRELSKRSGQRQQRVVVKFMCDKAGLASFSNPRQHLKPEVYSGKTICLPKPEEMPHLDFEMIGFHRPLLGTLHAKFMVIDRKIAVVQSNNMEDNDNMEMMAHVEGPIVDSIYDTVLITWGDKFAPSLPSATEPEIEGGLETIPPPKEPLYLDRPPAPEQSQVVREGEKSSLTELMPGTADYDLDTASEIVRMQSAYSCKQDESHLQAINRQLNLPCKNPCPPSGPDITAPNEFTPYIPTSTLEPVPIALVSRQPFGPPNNSNVFVPQNEAWLSCIRNAQTSVFIQTPDLNATQLFEALIAAVKRGVKIIYYVCLGYNDPGEIMPGQGGTNEMFAKKLTETLSRSPEADAELLSIHYYVAKDQDHPIHNSFKQRSCHIKLLIVDDSVAIQGSGNQDTQSWCHSQEINILIDSADVCRKWREGIERNQNTSRFGRASRDGIWRDSAGKVAGGSWPAGGATVQGPVGWIRGGIGMVQKAVASGRPHG